MVTVQTSDGARVVTIDADTIIQKSAIGALEDLTQGTQIAVFGVPAEGEDGAASFVVVVPEGASNLFERGLFFGERLGSGERPGGFFGGGRRSREGGSFGGERPSGEQSTP